MSKRNGQNFGEYVILIAIVIAVGVAMQVYLRRGFQGRVADVVDYTPGINGWNFNTKQYEPYYLEQESTVESDSDYTETANGRGETIRNGIETKTTNGVQRWGPADDAAIFDNSRYY